MLVDDKVVPITPKTEDQAPENVVPEKRSISAEDRAELNQLEAQITNLHMQLGSIEADVMGIEERKESAKNALRATARERDLAYQRLSKRYHLTAQHRVNRMTGEIIEPEASS